MRTLRKILRYLLLTLFVAVLLAYALFQMPFVQTWLSSKAIDKVEEIFDARITLGRIALKPFTTLIIQDLNVIDPAPISESARDTLLHVDQLSATFSLMSLMGPGHEDFILKRVKLKGATFSLVIEGGEIYSTNLTRMFHIRNDAPAREPVEKDIFHIQHLEGEGIRYTMQNFSIDLGEKPPYSIDWCDFEVYDANLEATDFRMSHGRFYADVSHMDFKEKTGWVVTHMSGSTVSGRGDAYIYNLHVEDDTGSHFDADYRMVGKTDDFKDYVNKVYMSVDVHESHLSASTLAHFIPALYPDRSCFFNLVGHAEGPVVNLSMKNARLAVDGTRISTVGNGRVTGLPEYRKMGMDLSFTNTHFNSKDLTKLLHSIAPASSELDLGRLGGGLMHKADIYAKGNINDLLCRIGLQQSVGGGKATADARIHNLLNNKPISLEGHIEAKELDLGQLIGIEKLGNVSLKSKLGATLPSRGAELYAEIDQMEISSLDFMGYAYKGISVDAELDAEDLNAAITSKDPNCLTDISVWTDKYSYNATVYVEQADLNAMKLDKRGTSKVHFNLYSHLNRNFNSLMANVSANDIVLTGAQGANDISNINVMLEQDGDIYSVTANSDDFNAGFEGNKKNLKANITIHDLTGIMGFMLPGSFIDKGSYVEVSKDSLGNVSGKLNSHRIALNEYYIKDLDGSLGGSLDNLNAQITAQEAKIGAIKLLNNSFGLKYADRVAKLSYNFDNKSQQASYGSLMAEIAIGKDKDYSLQLKPTEVFVNGDKWEISQAYASMKGKEINVEGVALHGKDQWITLNGRTSAVNQDSMKARIHNMDISFLNNFIQGFSLDVQGRLNAEMTLESPLGEDIPRVELNLDMDRLMAGGKDLGRLRAACEYDSELQQLHINANQNIGQHDAMLAYAILKPDTRHLDATITMDSYPFDFARAFIPSVFSEMEGKLSGDFFLNGPLNNLTLSSKGGRVDKTYLRVAFTHVPYVLDGTLHLDNKGIHIDDVKGMDRFGSPIIAHGGVNWDLGRNMVMDVSLDANNVECINMPSAEPGIIFFGHIFGTGNVRFHGPFNSLTMSANVRPVGNSDIHLVTSRSMTATKTGLLTFKDKNDSERDAYEEHLTLLREKRRRMTEFKINLHALADPTFKVYLDLGSDQFSSGLQGVGNGEIDLNVNTATVEYGIYGDYVLTEGKVDINASNLVRRVFQIENGSSIKFVGDIFDSTVDLNAKYETKASIASLIADNQGSDGRRTVQCGLGIHNSLRNPEIKFSINIPDLNPSIKSSVESALSTEDKVQKQFLSLLLSNNFLPDEQSGIVNNSSLLFSNVSEIMANQVNNIFNKLDIPLDLGLNYQPTESGANLFDVALSTQLFNNRVIIGGNFGNKQNLTTNSDTFFGDFDVQYKVTRSGALRVMAFSHSADSYSNFLDNSQRNGIGVTWQQEFDNFPEWFKRLFSDKAKREALLQMEATKSKKRKTIILDEQK